MRNLFAALTLGIAQPVLAQSPGAQPDSPSQPAPAEEKEIVVTGVADGARVVEVDFDKVWKNCAECKRALAKLDKLAQNYRDEVAVARIFASGGGQCGNARPSSSTTFQHSSAESIGDPRPRTPQSIADGLCAARQQDSSERTSAAVGRKYAAPEQARLLAHMRSFLDQLAPHLNEATEAERVAHRASAGLTDVKRTRLNARNLQRIDVTRAVIRRLDAKDFKIILADPSPPGPARGGYQPPKG